MSPWRFERGKLRVGVGPSLRFLSDSRPNGYHLMFRSSRLDLPSDMDYVIAPPYYARPHNYWTIGYTLVLEGEINLAPRWLMGIRASVQPYQSGEIVSTLGFNGGYKF